MKAYKASVLVAIMIIQLLLPVSSMITVSQDYIDYYFDPVSDYVFYVRTHDIGMSFYYGYIDGLYVQTGIDPETNSFIDDDMFKEAFDVFESPASNYSAVGSWFTMENYTVVENNSLYAKIQTGSISYEALGTQLEFYRIITIIKTKPLIIVTTVVKNKGNTPVHGAEFYDYNDIDLVGADNDYLVLPLNGVPTRVNVEGFIPADRLSEPWLIQTDTVDNRSVGVIFGSPEYFRGVYLAYYHGESPPNKVVIDNESITTGDVVFAGSWSLDLDPGEEARFTIAYTSWSTPDRIRELMPLVGVVGGLSARAVAPSYVYWNMSFPLELVLASYSGDASYSVSIDVPEGFSVISSPTSSGSLGAGGSTGMTWTIGVGSPSPGLKTIKIVINYTITVEGESRSGSIVKPVKISVEPSPYKYTIISTARADGPGTITINHTVPDSLYHTTNITLSGDPGVLQLTGVENLIGYPYGCAEQRTSKLLAVIEAYNYLEKQGSLSSEQAARLLQIIVQAAIELVDQQHDDGGWGWYPNYESSVFFTSYVMIGLATTVQWANAHGVYLPASNTGRTVMDALYAGAMYLQDHQDANGAWTPQEYDYVKYKNLLTTYALQALVMAYQVGAGADSDNIQLALGYLVNQSSNGGIPREPGTSPDALTTAMFLRAVQSLGSQAGPAGDAASQAASWLASASTESGETSYWSIDYHQWGGSRAAVTALAASSLYTAGYTTEALRGVSWLLGNTDSWMYSSTITKATVLATLNIIVENSGSGTNAVASVSLNGEHVFNAELVGLMVVDHGLDTRIGENTIRVDITGSGPVNIVVETTYWILTQEPQQPAGEEPGPTGSYTLQWTFSSPDSEGRIQTTLTITNDQPLDYVIVEVPLPEGYTVDPQELAEQGYALDQDRGVIAIPIQHLDAGTHTISLTLIPTVENPSLTKVIKPRMSLMYQPGSEAYAQVDAQAVGAQPVGPGPSTGGGGEQPGPGGGTTMSPAPSPTSSPPSDSGTSGTGGTTSPQGETGGTETSTGGETGAGGSPVDRVRDMLGNINTVLLVIIIILLVAILIKKK